MARFLGKLLLLAGLGFVAAAVGYLVLYEVFQGGNATVPTVIGMETGAAVQALVERGLVASARRRPVEGVRAGIVADQDPPPGRTVKRNGSPSRSSLDSTYEPETR